MRNALFFLGVPNLLALAACIGVATVHRPAELRQVNSHELLRLLPGSRIVPKLTPGPITVTSPFPLESFREGGAYSVTVHRGGRLDGRYEVRNDGVCVAVGRPEIRRCWELYVSDQGHFFRRYLDRPQARPEPIEISR